MSAKSPPYQKHKTGLILELLPDLHSSPEENIMFHHPQVFSDEARKQLSERPVSPISKVGTKLQPPRSAKNFMGVEEHSGTHDVTEEHPGT